MISTIFEILALLAISCLFGIFFTYRFWKAKYAILLSKNQELTSDKYRLNAEIQALTAKRNELETFLKEATKEVINKESREASRINKSKP